jgi:hypothetical protein
VLPHRVGDPGAYLVKERHTTSPFHFHIQSPNAKFSMLPGAANGLSGLLGRLGLTGLRGARLLRRLDDHAGYRHAAVRR